MICQYFAEIKLEATLKFEVAFFIIPQKNALFLNDPITDLNYRYSQQNKIPLRKFSGSFLFITAIQIS